jgi:hypothetical protein
MATGNDRHSSLREFDDSIVDSHLIYLFGVSALICHNPQQYGGIM